MKSLFADITIKDIDIKNRIVMPPMVCFGWTDDSGLVSQQHIKHYEDRAKGGVGLIIIEAHCIEKSGRLAPSQLGIWSDEHIDGLRKIADACHKYGAAVLVQIHHAGLKAHPDVSDAPVTSSDNSNARGMTIEEIHSIQQSFADAAARAEKAGLDGIELHGAHGYLISQFMSPSINKRTDMYGGSLENRMRFALETIDGVKKAVNNKNSFIIGYRMGANEPLLEDGVKIAKALERAGVDLLHVSAGMGGEELPSVPSDFPYNWIVYSGTCIKKEINIPVIVVNDINKPERAAYLIENGLADFTAIGKGLLVDAQWAAKAKEDREIISCLKCRGCHWFKDSKKCPQNR